MPIRCLISGNGTSLRRPCLDFLSAIVEGFDAGLRGFTNDGGRRPNQAIDSARRSLANQPMAIAGVATRNGQTAAFRPILRRSTPIGCLVWRNRLNSLSGTDGRAHCGRPLRHRRAGEFSPQTGGPPQLCTPKMMCTMRCTVIEALRVQFVGHFDDSCGLFCRF